MSGISCHIRYLRYSYFVLNVIVYILNYFMINHCHSVTSLCFILRPCIYHSRFLNEVFSVFIMFTNLKDLRLSLILLSWYTALLLIRWQESAAREVYCEDCAVEIIWHHGCEFNPLYCPVCSILCHNYVMQLSHNHRPAILPFAKYA